MAAWVLRLFQASGTGHSVIFSMRGHQNGIVSFGTSAGEASSVLLRSLAAAIATRREYGSNTKQE
jgi:hypothetical protein